MVGAGDVGARLIAQLTKRLGQHISILAITRRTEQARRLRCLGARILALNLEQRRDLQRLAAFRQRVVHLAPPPASGSSDPRTRNLLSVLSRSAVEQANHHTGRLRQAGWIYASTTGVYGDVQGALIDETRRVRPNSDRAKRRVEAERQWRAAGARGVGRTVVIRVPGIYAADRLPLERLQKGLPALREQDDVHTNHINAEDLARILWLALMRGRSNRIYHAVDNSEIKMGAYFDLVADSLNLPRPPRFARQEVAQKVSPAMMSFMQESRRLGNRRLLKELRVSLRYPTVSDTLAQAGRIRAGPE